MKPEPPRVFTLRVYLGCVSKRVRLYAAWRSDAAARSAACKTSRRVFPGLKTPMKIDDANGAPSIREILASLCARMAHRCNPNRTAWCFSLCSRSQSSIRKIQYPPLFSEGGTVCIDRLHLRSVTTDIMRSTCVRLFLEGRQLLLLLLSSH